MKKLRTPITVADLVERIDEAQQRAAIFRVLRSYLDRNLLPDIDSTPPEVRVATIRGPLEPSAGVVKGIMQELEARAQLAGSEAAELLAFLVEPPLRGDRRPLRLVPGEEADRPSKSRTSASRRKRP